MVFRRQIFSGSPTTMRELNKRLILESIRKNGITSRIDLAKSTRLSPTSMTNIIKELRTENILKESGREGRRNGRKPFWLEINGGYKYAVGIEVADERIEGVVLNLKGQEVASIEISCSPEYHKDKVLELLVQAISGILIKTNISTTDLLGIGVGIQGVVDATTGTSIYLPFFNDWKDVQVKKFLEERFEVPCMVDNRISAVTFGEIWHGAEQTNNDFIYVNVGKTGMAMGIVLGGKVIRGTANSAGQIGHLILDDNGPQCYCGKRGCAETLVTPKAIVRRAQEELDSDSQSVKSCLITKEVTFEEIVEAAAGGDSLAVSLLKEAGHYLGIVISNVINIFNPPLIIIGGEIILAGDLLLNTVKETVKNKALELNFKTARITFSTFHPDAAAAGAASMILENFFRIPEAVIV